jgi:3-dehydroquinate dehydratase/shikimate dehydrogenase
MNKSKICVSICAETANELSEKLRRGAAAADFVEIRFDCLDGLELDKLLSNFERLRQSLDEKKLLITFRPKQQGGRRELELNERKKFWNAISQLRLKSLFDIELDLQNEFAPLPFSSRIASFHDFGKMPENLESIYQNLAATDCKILKIAVQANDAADGLNLMKLLERAQADGREMIAIAMNEYGVWTRILSLSRGAFLTFASLEEDSKTAPGQLTVGEMTNVYRVKELDRDTEIYGLVASSTAHSVSPEMHNAAFRFHNLNAVYVPFAVRNLAEFVRRMARPFTREIDWNLRGFSVTLPHKIEIMRHLDFIDETARRIGAVNTVKIVGDKLHGFNTDADGFIEPLKNAYGDLRGAQVAVLGAGGAARAVVYALRREAAEVTIFARNLAKAKSLADDFGARLESLPMQNLKSKIQNPPDIVVNATPLGMKKDDLERETPATAAQLENVKLVYDLIYNPFETTLMREAGKVFVPTLGGLAMLVAQAMIQQKIWTNLDAPMKEISQAALRKIKN